MSGGMKASSICSKGVEVKQSFDLVRFAILASSTISVSAFEGGILNIPSSDHVVGGSASSSGSRALGVGGVGGGTEGGLLLHMEELSLSSSL